MILPRSLITQTVAHSALADHAVRRLLLSISVPVPVVGEGVDESSENTERFQLGLNIELKDLLFDSSTESSMERVARLCAKGLDDYKASCPLIVDKIKRDEFRPEALASELSRGVILHASRTAGRIRASIYRAARE